jgi:asparagine synthetase A
MSLFFLKAVCVLLLFEYFVFLRACVSDEDYARGALSCAVDVWLLLRVLIKGTNAQRLKSEKKKKKRPIKRSTSAVTERFTATVEASDEGEMLFLPKLHVGWEY